MFNPADFVTGLQPRDPDERDWKVAELINGTVPQVEAIAPVPDLLPPTPKPIPDADGWVRWRSGKILDQGKHGWCVGFTGADFLNNPPVPDADVTDLTGQEIYYECKIIDGEKGKENGSNLRSLGKALVNRTRINAYAFASTTNEIRDWVLNNGTVMMGTNWYEDMFHPDKTGFIHVSGHDAGGHAWSITGYNVQTGLFEGQNHWGTAWGIGGYFTLAGSDLQRLLDAQGDAMVAVELALPLKP